MALKLSDYPTRTIQIQMAGGKFAYQRQLRVGEDWLDIGPSWFTENSISIGGNHASQKSNAGSVPSNSDNHICSDRVPLSGRQHY